MVTYSLIGWKVDGVYISADMDWHMGWGYAEKVNAVNIGCNWRQLSELGHVIVTFVVQMDHSIGFQQKEQNWMNKGVGTNFEELGQQTKNSLSFLDKGNYCNFLINACMAGS